MPNHWAEGIRKFRRSDLGNYVNVKGHCGRDDCLIVGSGEQIADIVVVLISRLTAR